jgi:hypothetical protein
MSADGDFVDPGNGLPLDPVPATNVPGFDDNQDPPPNEEGGPINPGKPFQRTAAIIYINCDDDDEKILKIGSRNIKSKIKKGELTAFQKFKIGEWGSDAADIFLRRFVFDSLQIVEKYANELSLSERDFELLLKAISGEPIPAALMRDCSHFFERLWGEASWWISEGCDEQDTYECLHARIIKDEVVFAYGGYEGHAQKSLEHIHNHLLTEEGRKFLLKFDCPRFVKVESNCSLLFGDDKATVKAVRAFIPFRIKIMHKLATAYKTWCSKEKSGEKRTKKLAQDTQIRDVLKDFFKHGSHRIYSMEYEAKWEAGQKKASKVNASAPVSVPSVTVKKSGKQYGKPSLSAAPAVPAEELEELVEGLENTPPKKEKRKTRSQDVKDVAISPKKKSRR